MSVFFILCTLICFFLAVAEVSLIMMQIAELA